MFYCTVMEFVTTFLESLEKVLSSLKNNPVFEEKL
jgi:hypothetical protein